MAPKKNKAAATQDGFRKGDSVLLKVPHLHGIAATVLESNDDGVVCRVAEESFEGHVVVFAADKLERVSSPAVLAQAPGTRLPFDYNQE